MLATLSALLAVFIADLKKQLVADGLTIAVKLAPWVTFISVFSIEWITGSVWLHFQMMALLVSGIVIAMDLFGWLPRPSNAAPKPAAPVAPVAPPATPAKS